MIRRNARGDGIAPAPTDAILESISDGVFTVDLEWRITSFNRAAEEITGMSRKEAIGRLCSEVFRSSMCEAECALRRTLKTGKPVIGQSGYIIDADGSRIPISISTARASGRRGQIIGGAETFRDLSEVEALAPGAGGEIPGRRSGEPQPPDAEGVRGPPRHRRQPQHGADPRRNRNRQGTGGTDDSLPQPAQAGAPSSRSTAALCRIRFWNRSCSATRPGPSPARPRTSPGRFALAKGGTLFLDEIGEVSPALQVRLLRVLQDRTYEPLGATRSETADARIIVATNKDLAEQMRKGAFREDLYYRVNVVRVELPPLRRRKEDIPLLVEQFIARFNRLQQKTVPGIAAEAFPCSWPMTGRETSASWKTPSNAPSSSAHEGRIGIEHLPDELTAHGAGRAWHAELRSRPATCSTPRPSARRSSETASTAWQRRGSLASTRPPCFAK